MANLLSLLLPLVFTFVIAAWGPLSVKDKSHASPDRPSRNAHRPPPRETHEQ